MNRRLFLLSHLALLVPCRALQPGDRRLDVKPWAVEEQLYTPQGWKPSHKFRQEGDYRIQFDLNPRTGEYHFSPANDWRPRGRQEWT